MADWCISFWVTLTLMLTSDLICLASISLWTRERERERERDREIERERGCTVDLCVCLVLFSLMSLLLGTILVCDYATLSFPCQSNLFFWFRKKLQNSYVLKKYTWTHIYFYPYLVVVFLILSSASLTDSKKKRYPFFYKSV